MSGGTRVDEDRARRLLRDERARVSDLLRRRQAAEGWDQEAEGEVGDTADLAQSLTAEGVDDAVAASLKDRLAAIERAERRLRDGSYGRSVRSGQPIPDERLEADPAAELTVEEARSAP